MRDACEKCGEFHQHIWQTTDERELAQQEAACEFIQASKRTARPHITLAPPGELLGQDITEDVVSIVDALINSLDWGSGFLTDEEVQAVSRLARLLNFKLTGEP